LRKCRSLSSKTSRVKNNRRRRRKDGKCKTKGKNLAERRETMQKKLKI